MARDLLEPLVLAAARAGGSASEVGVRLDLARSTGLRGALVRRREEQRARAPGRSPGSDPYQALWLDAAHAIGATARVVADGAVEVELGGRHTTVRGRDVPLDDPGALARALDKSVTRGLLAAAGIPVPDAVEYAVTEVDAARAFLELVGGPCVVKPAAGTDAGSGVTSGVRTRGQLARATLRAARLQSRLLLERQLGGDVHRVLVLDDAVIGASRRLPPSVTGDGTSSIADLISAQNRLSGAETDRPGASLLRVDLDCVFTLAASGRTLRAVPAAGEVVVVKRVASQGTARETIALAPADLHPSVSAAARASAAALGLRLAGVDVITSDAGRPLAETGGGVIEVNGTPGLLYHYRVADPATASPVAEPILRALLGAGA
jgi:cyanophycin synthetase